MGKDRTVRHGARFRVRFLRGLLIILRHEWRKKLREARRCPDCLNELCEAWEDGERDEDGFKTARLAGLYCSWCK